MTAVTSVTEDGVSIITIDRPGQLNALDAECRRELLEALRSAAADDHVRAVVLTGAGRAFCVGHDLTAKDGDDVLAMIRDSYNPLARAIADMPKIVIAAVNGPAVGAGLGLALQCDLQVMAHDAYLSCAFGKVGLVPDTGVSTALVRAVGRPRALELALSGRRVLGQEAFDLGFVTRLAAPGDALAHALVWAKELASGALLSTALTKALFRVAEYRDLDGLLELEARSQALASASPGFVEGVTAFVEKRPAAFPIESLDMPDDLRSDFRRSG